MKIISLLGCLIIGASASLAPRLLAADSPRDVKIIGHASVPPWSRSLFNGLAQIIVQSTRDAGEFKLTATAGGLSSATVVVPTQPRAPRPSAL